MLEHYQNANLIPFLETIRKDGRYAGLNGVNVLTNAALGGAYNRDEVTRELRRAALAGEEEDDTFRPEFSHPKQGLAYGLNPYTDWSLAQLKAPPTRYYLFLGLDWYSISALGHSDSWFEYIRNPFAATKDRYWHNLWAWILRKHRVRPSGRPSWDTPIKESEAADFIRADGGAFIFHNLIPYLRPAASNSAGTRWYESEWKRPPVRKDILQDLGVLLSAANSRIIAITTGERSVTALLQAGYDRRHVYSWKAHPSRVFNPSQFLKRDFWFRGRDL